MFIPTFTFFDTFETLEKGKKDALQMYKPEHPGHAEAKAHTDWAYTKLPNENWALWTTRHHRTNPQDFTPEVKQEIEHFAGSQHIPEIANVRFDKNVDLPTGLKTLKDAEKAGQRRIKASLRLAPKPRKAKKIMSFEDGYSWWNLGQGSCEKEGSAMGHCGNVPSEVEGDEIWSLRKEHNIGGKKYYEPHLTFIHNQGFLGEMKGRNNEKPTKQYHSKIHALLDQTGAVPFGGGYAPQNNFDIKDLEPEKAAKLFEKHHKMKIFLDPEYVVGMQDIEGAPDKTLDLIASRSKMSPDAERHLIEQQLGQKNARNPLGTLASNPNLSSEGVDRIIFHEDESRGIYAGISTKLIYKFNRNLSIEQQKKALTDYTFLNYNPNIHPSVVIKALEGGYNEVLSNKNLPKEALDHWFNTPKLKNDPYLVHALSHPKLDRQQMESVVKKPTGALEVDQLTAVAQNENLPDDLAFKIVDMAQTPESIKGLVTKTNLSDAVADKIIDSVPDGYRENVLDESNIHAFRLRGLQRLAERPDLSDKNIRRIFDKKVVPLSNIRLLNITPETVTHIVKNSPANGTEKHFSDAEKALNIFYGSNELTPESATILVNNNQDSSNLNNLRHKLGVIASNEKIMNKEVATALMNNKSFDINVSRKLQDNPNTPPDIKSKLIRGDTELNSILDQLGPLDDLQRSEHTKVASVAAFKDGLILFGKRNDNDKWALAGGHIEEGESPTEGVIRELWEETGLVPNDLEYLGSGIVTKANVIVYAFKCNVSGEATSENDPDEEFETYRWVDPDNIPEEIANNLHSPKNIVLEKLGLQGPEELDKSIKDIPKAADPSTTDLGTVFDYSYILDPKHNGYSLKMHDRSNGDLNLVLEHSGKKIGELQGNASDGSIKPGYAWLRPEHRGMGIGTKMYEALLAHSYHNYNTTEVVGGIHSSAASKIHRKLSSIHGMTYDSKESRTKPADASLSPVGFVGDFDNRFGPYRYTIKTELNKTSDKQKVGRVIRDWQRHVKPFEDVEYWSKRFTPHEEVFARNKPKGTVQLWRSERTDIDNQYDKRHTSWSTNPNDINNFGWGTRRMVTGYFKPEHILASLPHLGLDTEGLGEVIIRPGNHQVIPWKLAFDRQGAFNIHEEPERAKAGGLLEEEPIEKGLGAMVLAGIIGAGIHAPKTMPTKYSDLMGNHMSYENLHEDLIPIAQLESSGGKFTNHAKNSAGEFHTAFGPLGLKISTAHEQWRKHPELQKQYPNMKDPAVFMAAIKKNPAMYNAIASSHFNTLKQKHGSPEKAAAAWRHGSGAVFKMKPEQIENDDYVVKYKQMHKTESLILANQVWPEEE